SWLYTHDECDVSVLPQVIRHIRYEGLWLDRKSGQTPQFLDLFKRGTHVLLFRFVVNGKQIRSGLCIAFDHFLRMIDHEMNISEEGDIELLKIFNRKSRWRYEPAIHDVIVDAIDKVLYFINGFLDIVVRDIENRWKNFDHDTRPRISPNTQPIAPMIQNRITTMVSGQPVFSK